MSSEEDASMALQVSNALTQALLQFRMNNLSQEVREQVNNGCVSPPLLVNPQNAYPRSFGGPCHIIRHNFVVQFYPSHILVFSFVLV